MHGLEYLFRIPAPDLAAPAAALLAPAGQPSQLPPTPVCFSNLALPVCCIPFGKQVKDGRTHVVGVVVHGAPLGSLLLTNRRSGVQLQRALRASFYMLAVAQLVAFHVLAPPARGFWAALLALVVLIGLLLRVHHTLVVRATPDSAAHAGLLRPHAD